MVAGKGERERVLLSRNFLAERYVLRMYDGFQAWNFRRSPFRPRKITATCATRALYTALV